MKRRITSLLLTIFMIVSMVPVITVYAEDAVAENYLILANDYDNLGTWSIVTGEEGSWDNVGYITGLKNKKPAEASSAVATVNVKIAGTCISQFVCAKHEHCPTLFRI